MGRLDRMRKWECGMIEQRAWGRGHRVEGGGRNAEVGMMALRVKRAIGG